jgi:RHS repeat-associated protein
MFGRRLFVGMGLAAAALAVPGSSQALYLGARSGDAPAAVRSIAATTTAAPSALPAGAVAVASLASRFSNTYSVPKSRQYLSVVYAAAVNYKDAAGAWTPIDNALVSSSDTGFALQNKANSYRLRLPSDLGAAPVRVDVGDQWLSFQLVGAHGAPTASGNTARYASALPGVSASYTAESDQVKENLSLASVAATSTYSYTLQTSAGLTPQAAKSGEVQFVDSSGKVVAAFAPPSMRDAAGAASSDVSVALTQVASRWTLTETASQSWLSAATRKFPVVVDPSVVFYANDLPTDVDCTISTSSLDTPLCGGQTLDVGYDGTNTSRALLKFHPELALPNNSQVLNAELHLYLVASSGMSSSTVDAQQLNEDWSSWASWNHRDFYNTWSTAGGTFASSPAASQTVATTPGWYSFYPTGLTSGWLHKSTANDGLLLKGDNETATGVSHFASAESADPSLAPYLTIRWEAWLGSEPWFNLSGMGLTDRMGLHVNLATGNLMVEATDVHLAGIAGQDLTIGRWFNNLSGITGDLGNNWLMSVGRDVGITTMPDGSAVVYMPTGTEEWYAKNGTGFSPPPGANADLTHNTDGTWTLKFHNDDSTWTFDSSGRLAKQADTHNNAISFSYDPSNGALQSITDARGKTTSFVYGADGYVSQITDPAGRTYQYARSANPNVPNLASYTDPAGNETHFAYAHPHGQWDLTDITTPEQRNVSITYDAQSRVTSIMRSGPNETNGPTWTFSYATSDSRCPDGTVSVVTATDPNENATTYCSDALARVTKTIDPLGRTATTTWNSNNDVASQTNAAGGTTDYSYNPSKPENLVKVQGPASPQGLRQTDSLGYGDSAHPFYPTAYTDAQQHSWAFRYDDAGDQIQKSEGDAAGQNPVATDYNSDGTVSGILDAKQTNACMDSKGNPATLCYSYDASHNPTQIDYPAPLGSFHFTWDSLGRLTSITDGKNQTTTYSYSSLDRLEKITYNDGSTIDYAYDKDGNLLSETDGTQVTSYAYDGAGRMITETKPGGSTIQYAHDAGGRLTSITENGQQTTYGYDASDRLTSVQEPGVPAAIGISYPDQTHSTIAYPGGASVAYTYDNSGRVTSVADKNAAGTTVASYSYGYTYTDANGGQQDGSLRSSVTTLDGTTTYGYDPVGRLSDANGPDGHYAYSYDANGNMLSKSTPAGSAIYTPNAANELTSGCTYDANGNLTSMPGLTLGYDDREQTSTITPSGQSALSASYFGPGQMQRTGFGGDAYLNDALGIGRWTSSGTATDFTRDPSGTELSDSVGGTHYYYAFDGLGSVVGLFDATGNLVSNYVAHYEPYGKPINNASTGYPAMPIRFAGYWLDTNTGLYKVGARYYDPSTGRWTQRDPMDNPYDLHGWNRYIYAGDDPVNFTDSSGMRLVISWRGGEIVFRQGGQPVAFRISLFGHNGAFTGSRGGPWYRNLPHYHMRGPGGIGRHRPWQKGPGGIRGRLGITEGGSGGGIGGPPHLGGGGAEVDDA